MRPTAQCPLRYSTAPPASRHPPGAVMPITGPFALLGAESMADRAVCTAVRTILREF